MSHARLWTEKASDAAADIRSLKVQAIQKFTSTASAVEDLAAVQEGKLTDAFSKFLVDATGGAGDTDGEKKKKKKKLEETLIVAEPKLGTFWPFASNVQV